MNRFALRSSRWILSAAIVCSIVGVASSAQALILKRGSTGTDVEVVQNTLKSQGFMSSNVNSTGYYGPITRNAVMNFQRARGLRVDGVVGPQTLNAMGLLGTGGSYDSAPVSDTGIVRVNSYLNVRSGPSTGYGVTSTLDSGQTVNLYEQRGNWYRVSTGNDWVHSAYIQKTNYQQSLSSF
ncbi:MAG: peptidoglycan-binding protein [Rivularia sp. (in: cyanobacteria)]|jgi:peptidoglycan hydrolase-like protein with peptidoglycan-binding domain